MAYVIPVWTPPALPILGSTDSFPVRRIFCVGRNYVEHQKEMGGDGREQPFFFIKSAHSLVPLGGDVHYPPKTSNLHYETEMVVAIARQGRRIAAKDATGYIFGYAVGLDMTRRDLQQIGKDKGRPWDFGKDFDEAAPCSAFAPAAKIGHPSNGAIRLQVNGKERQKADLRNDLVSARKRSVPVSFYDRAGDLIYSGTPAGVGPVHPGTVTPPSSVADSRSG
jgi:fumarylpyruvate hydrolase